MLTIHHNSLNGIAKGRVVSATVRMSSVAMRLTPGRYKVVKAGRDPVLGGVIIASQSPLLASVYQEIGLSCILRSASNTNALVLSERDLGSAPSLIVENAPPGFYALPEVGDEVVVS